MVDRKRGPSGIGEDTTLIAEQRRQREELLSFLQNPGRITVFLARGNGEDWEIAIRLRHSVREAPMFYDTSSAVLLALSGLPRGKIRDRVKEAQQQLIFALNINPRSSSPTSELEADR